jgi:hypothetical protein
MVQVITHLVGLPPSPGLVLDDQHEVTAVYMHVEPPHAFDPDFDPRLGARGIKLMGNGKTSLEILK